MKERGRKERDERKRKKGEMKERGRKERDEFESFCSIEGEVREKISECERKD